MLCDRCRDSALSSHLARRTRRSRPSPRNVRAMADCTTSDHTTSRSSAPGHTTHTYILTFYSQNATQCRRRSLRSPRSNHTCPVESSNHVSVSDPRRSSCKVSLRTNQCISPIRSVLVVHINCYLYVLSRGPVLYHVTCTMMSTMTLAKPAIRRSVPRSAQRTSSRRCLLHLTRQGSTRSMRWLLSSFCQAMERGWSSVSRHEK